MEQQNFSKTAKYLATLLLPLTSSEYKLAKSIKNKKIPDGYKMISFDVKNLCNNVPLQETIKMIIRKIYEDIRYKHPAKGNGKNYFTYSQNMFILAMAKEYTYKLTE